jgi:hypothetical protein
MVITVLVPLKFAQTCESKFTSLEDWLTFLGQIFVLSHGGDSCLPRALDWVILRANSGARCMHEPMKNLLIYVMVVRVLLLYSCGGMLHTSSDITLEIVVSFRLGCVYETHAALVPL